MQLIMYRLEDTSDWFSIAVAFTDGVVTVMAFALWATQARCGKCAHLLNNFGGICTISILRTTVVNIK